MPFNSHETDICRPHFTQEVAEEAELSHEGHPSSLNAPRPGLAWAGVRRGGRAARRRRRGGRPAYLCSGGRSCASLAGSGVLGITPRMVLCSEVPLSRRLRTSCRLRAESTLVRMVEPGRSTPSLVSSSGRRLGIWMGLTDDMVTAVRAGEPSNTAAATALRDL